MISSTPTYQQGDIVVVNFPFTDVSQTKKRPALVLSNHLVNQTGDYLLVQITSQLKRDGLSLPLIVADFSQQPLPLTSYLRIHKIFLLNESLISHKATAVTTAFRQRLVSEVLNLIQ